MNHFWDIEMFFKPDDRQKKKWFNMCVLDFVDQFPEKSRFDMAAFPRKPHEQEELSLTKCLFWGA